MEDTSMRVVLVRDGDTGWRLESPDEGLVAAPNAYLRYLADRCYSPRTIRTYGYGLVAFARWLSVSGHSVEDVDVEAMLEFVDHCRHEHIDGRAGPNVVDLNGRRMDQLAPASINLRLAAVSGMYEFLSMRDPDRVSPIPKGRPSSWFAPGERSGAVGSHETTPHTPVPAAAAHPTPAPAGLVRCGVFCAVGQSAQQA